MKKWLIGIVLLVSIVIAVRQFSGNDYSSAKQLADAGHYKEFYVEIKDDLAKNNKEAENILIDYFLKAVQDDDIEEVAYYLENSNKNLINYTNKNGDRAVDVVLFEKIININMLNLLLKYKPELNYVIKFYNFTPIQVIVTGYKNSVENLEALKLLIENNADVNYYTQNGKSENSALAMSYVADNFKAFELLLQKGANLSSVYFNKDKKDKNDIVANIAGSYALQLQYQGIDLRSFYSKALSEKVRSTLGSVGYRIVHDKNMRYLNVILVNTSIDKWSNHGFESLAKWYIKTNELKGLEFLVMNGLCTKNLICNKMKDFSIKEINRAALHILNKSKGE